MEDKELPGFKINDYSGEGASDVAEEAGGVAENGLVTHGEGDFRPVMVENGQVGGSEETALKTAPDGVAGDFGSGADGLTHSAERIAQGADGSGQITEAEARAMLIEDNARAKEDLKKAKSRGKKTLVAVIVLAVLLVVAGVVTSIILGGMRDDAGDDKHEGNSVVENPGKNEGDKGEGIVELSLNDALVQGIYGNFQGIPRLFDGWWGFYVDDGVRNGEVDKAHMLLLAGANYPEGACSGDYVYGNDGSKVTNECVSGETIRQKIAEMFGREVELAEGDKLSSFCAGKPYDVTNDEFFQAGNGCGGSSPERLWRVLAKAEQSGDEVYLYEKVLLFVAREYYHFGDTSSSDTNWGTLSTVFGEKIGEYAEPDYSEFQGHEDYNAWLEKTLVDLTNEYGEEFKWTFRKNAEGNYVFVGLTRVE